MHFDCDLAHHGLSPYTRGNLPKVNIFNRIMGLSPYTRGNHCHSPLSCGVLGSIPVHTGEPLARVCEICVLRVYPRTHGGTLVSLHICAVSTGLSPYTRGNLVSQCFGCISSRSIPVHTGEPHSRYGGRHGFKVYPRTHGGTDVPF